MLPQTVLRVGYVGIHGTHDDETYPVAQTTPTYVWYATKGVALPTGANAGVLQKPYDLNPDGSIASSVFGTVQELRKTGYSWTNGIQVEVEHRYNKGFQYQFQYNMLNAFRLGSGGGGTDDIVNDLNQYLPGTVPTDVEQAPQVPGLPARGQHTQAPASGGTSSLICRWEKERRSPAARTAW